MRNKFVAPKLRPPEPLTEKEKRKSKKDKKEKERENSRKLEEIGKRGSTESLAELSVELPAESVNQAVVVSSLPETAPDERRVPRERADGRSEISTASSAAMSAQKIVEFAKETILFSFVGVKVKKGELLGKDGGSKSHQGYEVMRQTGLLSQEIHFYFFHVCRHKSACFPFTRLCTTTKTESTRRRTRSGSNHFAP